MFVGIIGSESQFRRAAEILLVRFLDVTPVGRSGFRMLFGGLVGIVPHQHGSCASGDAGNIPGKVQFRGETSGEGLLHRRNRVLHPNTMASWCLMVTWNWYLLSCYKLKYLPRDDCGMRMVERLLFRSPSPLPCGRI